MCPGTANSATAVAAGRRRWLPPVAAGAAALAGCVALGLSDAGAAYLPTCPFRSLTGLDCPGCGLTRGVRQLVRGDPLAALDHNLLLVALVPAAAYLYVSWLASAFGVRVPLPAIGRRGAAVIVAVVVAFAVVRNLPIGLGRQLASGS